MSTIVINQNEYELYSNPYLCNIECENIRYAKQEYPLIPETNSKWIKGFQHDHYTYSFYNAIRVVIEQKSENYFSCFCSPLVLPDIQGVGETRKEALDKWQESFHLNFQVIYSKLHWERDEREKRLYEFFVKLVDIPETLLCFEQTGKVIKKYDDKFEIEWLDGHVNIVDLSNCPQELSAYDIGEYFRAKKMCKRKTAKLVKIIEVKRSNHKVYSKEDVDKFIQSIPVVKITQSEYWK
ncbi:MAG: hypothetical protein LBP59_10400 [Planctomycetaceae bacterium]|jgi:hypothetical protein|nr:hypothetical protein [Planctomycetaceae bacterium]